MEKPLSYGSFRLRRRLYLWEVTVIENETNQTRINYNIETFLKRKTARRNGKNMAKYVKDKEIYVYIYITFI